MKIEKMDTRQKIVIIGHGFLSRLSLVRAVSVLGGYEIVVVQVMPNEKSHLTKKEADCYSKYVDRVYYCIRNDEESLVSVLLDSCKSIGCKSIIIPDGDFEALAVDNNKSKLQDDFIFPHLIDESKSLDYWMDKDHQKHLAKQVGLMVANSVVVDVCKDVEPNLEGIKYPSFCKPLTTASGGKSGMCRCNCQEELAVAIKNMVNTRPNLRRVLVEDFIEIEKEYAVVGVSDGNNVCIPGIVEFIEGAAKMKGIAKIGKISPAGIMSDLVNQFKEYVLKVGFVGLFDIDFFESKGKFYFCELNLRWGGSGEAVTRMGINLPAMYVELLRQGKPVNPNLEIDNTSTYVNDRMCYQDWITNNISFKEMIVQLKSADIRFIPHPEDKGPEFAFISSILRNCCYKIAFRILRFFHLK